MFPHVQRHRSGHTDERGAVLITFALSLVAICAVIALVLGGSVGYTAERNSQTASDAAALAAAGKLRSFQLGELVLASDIESTAVSVAVNNGADEGDVECFVVRPDRSVIGACTASNVQDPNAAGIRVTTSDTRDVPFGEVGGQDTITGATLATATIQPLVTGNSPFMICSTKGLSGDGHPETVLLPTPPYAINPDAIGESYMLWSNGNDITNANRGCGAQGGSWSGWVDNSDEYSMPGWWQAQPGVQLGHLVPELVLDPDACAAPAKSDIEDLDGCVIIVPLCIESNGGGGATLEMRCVRFGAFKLSAFDQHTFDAAPCRRVGDNNNRVMCGEFLGGATAAQGQGSEEQAGVDDVVVIKLVE